MTAVVELKDLRRCFFFELSVNLIQKCIDIFRVRGTQRLTILDKLRSPIKHVQTRAAANLTFGYLQLILSHAEARAAVWAGAGRRTLIGVDRCLARRR